MKNQSDLRPLTIDFDQYTDGDSEFKKELVSLIILDITELMKSLADTVRLNEPEIFLKGCHKSKTTIEMVNDNEFTQLLQELKTQATESKNHERMISKETVLSFDKLAEELVTSLSELA